MWTLENRPKYNRDHLRRYPSDLTDDEWAYVAPLIPPAKPGSGKRRTSIAGAARARTSLPRGSSHRPLHSAKHIACTSARTSRVTPAHARRPPSDGYGSYRPTTPGRRRRPSTGRDAERGRLRATAAADRCDRSQSRPQAPTAVGRCRLLLAGQSQRAGGPQHRWLCGDRPRQRRRRRHRQGRGSRRAVLSCAVATPTRVEAMHAKIKAGGHAQPLPAAQAAPRAGVRADQTGPRLPPVPHERLRQGGCRVGHRLQRHNFLKLSNRRILSAALPLAAANCLKQGGLTNHVTYPSQPITSLGYVHSLRYYGQAARVLLFDGHRNALYAKSKQNYSKSPVNLTSQPCQIPPQQLHIRIFRLISFSLRASSACSWFH